jgi:cytochrome c biogenesis protein CcmG/thiol:disulfide interchange protein DsbE
VLEAIFQEYRDRGVTLLGVAVQDTESKAMGFVEEFGLTFPTGLDEGEIKEAYGVFGVPTTFFIDGEGFIRYTHAGIVTEDLLRHELEKLL